MRKIKVISLMLCMVLILSTLSACAPLPKIPFLNKNKEEQEQPAEDNRVTIVGTGVHSKGEEVKFENIAKVDQSVAGNVSGSLIYVNNAKVDKLPTTAPGSFKAIIAVEFKDGSTWSGEYSYKVEDKVAKLPDAITNALSELKWSVMNLKSNSGTATAKVTVATGVKPPVKEGDGMSVSTGEAHWEFMLLTKDEEEYLANNGVSPLRTSTTSIFVKSLAELANSVPQEGSGNSAEAKQYLKWVTQALDELIKVNTSETKMVVYKADGSSVPVKVAKVTYPQETGVKDVVQCYYVDYDDKNRIVMTYIPSAGLSHYDPIEDEDSSVGTNKYPATYEEVKQEISKGLTESMTTFVNPTSETNKEISILINRMILGDATSLIPKKADKQESTQSATEPTKGNDDKLTGAIGNVQKTYAQRHPDLFTWPGNENGDEYRRWIYSIEDGSSFIGSIWLGREGRYFNSEEDIIAAQGGQSSTPTGSTNQNQPTTSGTQSASIVTRYATYNFTNSSMKDVKIDNDKSTNSVIHLEYNGNKYYIESVSASTIQNYKASCIYSTSQFGSKDYLVEEYKTTDAKKGKVTSYTIQYFDMSGNKRTGGYMVVYNINNDYLVIYADNMDKDTTMMQQLITGMLI